MSIEPQIPIVNAAFLYVHGLQLSYLTSTSVTVSSGTARDSKDQNDIILSQDIILDATKSGVNGLDEGVFTVNTPYALYVIADSTGYKQTASIISKSYDRPILPFGYDMFRRVGSVCTDNAGVIIDFFQYGKDEKRTYYYNSLRSAITRVLLDGNATTFEEVPLSPCAPKVPIQAIFSAKYDQAVDTNYAIFSAYEAIPGLVAQEELSFGDAVTGYTTIIVPAEIGTISGYPSIIYQVNAGDTVTLYMIGYIEYI